MDEFFTFTASQQNNDNPMDHLMGCERRNISNEKLKLVRLELQNLSDKFCLWEKIAEQEFKSKFPVFKKCLGIEIKNEDKIDYIYLTFHNDFYDASYSVNLGGKSWSSSYHLTDHVTRMSDESKEKPMLVKLLEWINTKPAHQLGIPIFMQSRMSHCSCPSLKFPQLCQIKVKK